MLTSRLCSSKVGALTKPTESTSVDGWRSSLATTPTFTTPSDALVLPTSGPVARPLVKPSVAPPSKPDIPASSLPRTLITCRRTVSTLSEFLPVSTTQRRIHLGLRLMLGYYRSAYAAWAEVPGSQLYHGNQQKYLKTVTDYAVSKGMHVVLGLHSYPGGGECDAGWDIGPRD